MKKITIAILAFIYLGVSSGIAMNVHYCMGKISSIDLIHSKDKCGKCGMKSGGGGCCKDEFKIVKLSDTHKLVSNEIIISVPVADLPVYSNDFNFLSLHSYRCSYSNNNSPPGSSGRSICIFYSIFRI